jgi:DNA-binding response OmpR family regulator
MDQPRPTLPLNDPASDKFAVVFAAASGDEIAARTAGVALVVEDDWLLRQTLVDDLTAEGWTVLEAESGESALAAMRNDPGIDLLVTDIRLGGGLNGWDVAEAMRQKSARLAVIYVSANPAQASRQVTGSVFLTKPYVASKLLEACRALCGPKPQ